MKFISQLNKSFGQGGGFTCGLNDSDLTRFLQSLKRHPESQIDIAKGSVLIGQQPSSSIWVLNNSLQLTSKGVLPLPGASPYVWTPTIILSTCDKVSLSELVPAVPFSPDQLSSEPLSELLDILSHVCKHNFLSAVLLVGGAIMASQYSKVIGLFGGFPIILATGPPETGKSTAIKAALSLVGMNKDGFYVEGSTAYFMERSALSCLPYGIDEACSDSKQFDLLKLIIDLHGGAKTANLRRGAFLPRTAPIIATNFAMKDDQRYVTDKGLLYVYYTIILS